MVWVFFVKIKFCLFCLIIFFLVGRCVLFVVLTCFRFFVELNFLIFFNLVVLLGNLLGRSFFRSVCGVGVGFFFFVLICFSFDLLNDLILVLELVFFLSMINEKEIKMLFINLLL